jgi:hypothetical protein
LYAPLLVITSQKERTYGNTSNEKAPTYDNRIFDHGELSSISWFHQGDTPNVPPTSAMIVEFIKDNMIELAQEGFLADERLADNAGFLVG